MELFLLWLCGIVGIEYLWLRGSEEYFWLGDDWVDWNFVGVLFGVGGLGILLGLNKLWVYVCVKVD